MKLAKSFLFYLYITNTQYPFEALRVPQLSTKNGLDNINRLDEEAHTYKKKYSVSFSLQENTYESVSDKRIIKINYYIFYSIFPIILIYFSQFFIYCLVYLIIFNY
jgi:hypothetical protein